MEEKIRDLELRLAKLERIEKRRKGLLIAKISAIVLLIIAIIVGGYIAYKKVQETIKPYKEFIEKQKDFNNGVDKGINTIKGLFN